jgi:hypothetical protein
MTEDKMREEFEAWAVSICRDVTRYDDGACEYACMDTESDWLCWQASREALVIELPPLPKAQRSDEEATFSAGGCDMLRKCAKAIEAAGIKVQP